MSDIDPRSWLIEWFKNRNGDLPVDESEIDDANIFETQMIDSFGTIELVGAMESELNIRFTNDHYMDRRFTTIGGLSEMVHEIREQG